MFYYDFKDLQIQRTDQTSGGTRVENAASAELYGIETDVTWAVTSALEVGFGDNLLDEEYDILKVRQGTGGWHVPGLPRTWGVKLSASF